MTRVKKATKKMRDWQKSFYKEQSEYSGKNTKLTDEIQRLKTGMVEAAIGFGKAMGEAENQIKQLESKHEERLKNAPDYQKEFEEEFGLSPYSEVNWAS